MPSNHITWYSRRRRSSTMSSSGTLSGGRPLSSNRILMPSARLRFGLMCSTWRSSDRRAFCAVNTLSIACRNASWWAASLVESGRSVSGLTGTGDSRFSPNSFDGDTGALAAVEPSLMDCGALASGVSASGALESGGIDSLLFIAEPLRHLDHFRIQSLAVIAPWRRLGQLGHLRSTRPKFRTGKKIRVVAEQGTDGSEAGERRTLRVHHLLDGLGVRAPAGPLRNDRQIPFRISDDVLAAHANLLLRGHVLEKFQNIQIQVVPRDLRLEDTVILTEFDGLGLDRERALVDRHQGFALSDRMAQQVHEARIRECVVQPAQANFGHGVGRALFHGHQWMNLGDNLLKNPPRGPLVARTGPGPRHVDRGRGLLPAIDLGERAHQSMTGHCSVLRYRSIRAAPQVHQLLDIEQAQLRQPERLRMLAEHRVHQRGVGPRRGKQEER